jgi:hypothetical protein
LKKFEKMDSTNTAAAAAIASGTPARAEAAAAGYYDNNSRNWTLGQAEPSRGRGRQSSRSRTPNPSYVPRRQPQEPQLPVTFAGGRQLPNSEAAVAFNAMPSLSTTYVGGQNGNPNLNYIHPDSSSNLATTYQQHREYARSSPSSQLPSLTSANPKTLPQPLNDEFLIEIVSFNHPAQLDLDQIRRLNREQCDRRTTRRYCVEIAVFLDEEQAPDHLSMARMEDDS